MSKWLDAAKRAEPIERKPVLSVVSVLSEGGGADPAPRDTAPPKGKPKPAPSARPKPDTGDFPYGTACNLGDSPRTWTGRIVSFLWLPPVVQEVFDPIGV